MSEAPETAKVDDTSAAAPGTAQRDGVSAEYPAGTEAPASGAKPAAWRRYASPAFLIAAAALAVAAWQWHDSRGQLRAIKQELGKRLSETDTQSKESRIVTEQVREAVADAQVKLGVLEARIAESQNQQIALEALYQELSRNRDEWAYAEIEQAINIAAQQLQLAGNVKAALIALQTADSRLQRMDRPQLLALRRAINRDIDRLKALPFVDALAISTRLDNMIAGVDGFPLAMEMRPQPEAEAPVAAGGNAWTRFWREAWSDLKQLVRVQQMDKPEMPLLTPSQAFFLRENLKLRLIGARLSLLARDAASYKADVKAARDWLNRYYDTRNNNVAHAGAVLRNLHEAEVSIEAPDISGTLEAARTLRLARERTAR
ncbi:MAG TPA: uroporphyrinogen-III C-methyltransferase [Burkholderiales bacterium]|jgi:uroporphyrin-3 C-methyltransferase|nr:uroporphyrinogen-III C-methyltransferase [Burkholderiales bacterium]